MRFRTGLLIGLAVGYYYGSKAGRERYHEIEAWLDKLRATTTYQDARTKLVDGIREGTTVARRLIESSAFGGGELGADNREIDLLEDDGEPGTGGRGSLFSDPTLN